MPVPFLSKEWLQEAQRRIAASKEFAEAAKGMTTSVLNVVTGAPGGATLYVYYEFKDGKLTEASVGTKDRDAEFKVKSSYETSSLINQGKLSTMQAVFTRKIALDGNMGKAMKYARPLETFNKVVRELPTVY